jgi:DNA-binding response OmpR family regulator
LLKYSVKKAAGKEIHMKAERMGAAALFDKPFDIDEMLKKVAAILSATA